MDRKELLRIIEALTEADFARLIFYLDVPYGTVPSSQQPQTQRAIALLQWANSPTGCSLQKVVEELKEMGAITPSDESFTEKLPNNIALEMIAIPAGSFMMGSDEEEREQPIHKVTFAQGFFMGKYPITQAQYEAVMGNNPSYFKGGNNPVEEVSWNDAQEFCQKLSAQTGKKYKLPSEAQWEYACRAGSTGKWCFGDQENQLEDYAWYEDNSNLQTHSVGQKKANGWGLYDMHGNVWEWCEDDWHNNYDDENVPDHGTNWINKMYIVMRGGSWNNYPDYCRSAIRNHRRRDYRIDVIGFRVVCDSGRT